MDIIPGIVCMSRTGLEFGAQRYYSRTVAVAIAGGASGPGLNRYHIAVRERNCAGRFCRIKINGSVSAG